MVSLRPILRLVLLMSFGVAISSACFIRNCPLGGKRAERGRLHVADSKELGFNNRKCIKCGPKNAGYCVGPNICCGRRIGCYINSKESQVCARENDISLPCAHDGERCGAKMEGVCAANGVCCTDVHCKVDALCGMKRSSGKENAAKVSADVMQYLRRLIDTR